MTGPSSLLKGLFTLCSGIEPTADDGGLAGIQFRRAVSNWDSFQLPQLLLGESGLQATSTRRLLPEIRTNTLDQPCFADVWRQPDLSVSTPWLLLASSDLLLSEAALTNLAQACHRFPTGTVLVGRAWRVPDDLLASVDSPSAVLACADSHGCLDSPDLWSWAVLPSTCRFALDDDLGCSPERLVPHLIRRAHTLGWSVIDATPATPVLRPATPHQPVQRRRLPSEAVDAFPSPARANQVMVPQQPGAPQLSFLLVAADGQLDALAQRLCPLASLPWDVIGRSIDSTDSVHAVVEAWRSAFAASTGQLIWPLLASIPPLPLVASVLRCFDAPGIDQLVLPVVASSSAPTGNPTGSACSALFSESLVMQRQWLERLGGFPLQQRPADALAQLRLQAEQRGAFTHRLPLACRWSAA